MSFCPCLAKFTHTRPRKQHQGGTEHFRRPALAGTFLGCRPSTGRQQGVRKRYYRTKGKILARDPKAKTGSPDALFME